MNIFSIGDRVVHPMHGAGTIDSIVLEKINGTTQEYYVFKMPIGGLLLKIPTANSEVIGIRAIVQHDEAEEVIRSIPTLEIDMTTNWNRRYRENMLRLKSGDLYEVARVIKGLMRRDGERGLSTGERKMLHSAKQILISEIVLTENCSYEEVEERINQAMALVPPVSADGAEETAAAALAPLPAAEIPTGETPAEGAGAVVAAVVEIPFNEVSVHETVL